MSEPVRQSRMPTLMQALWNDIERLNKGIEVLQVRLEETCEELYDEINTLKRLLYQDPQGDSLITRMRLAQEREREWEAHKAVVSLMRDEVLKLDYVVCGDAGLCAWRAGVNRRFWSWMVSFSLSFMLMTGSALWATLQRVETLHRQVMALEMQVPQGAHGPQGGPR